MLLYTGEHALKTMRSTQIITVKPKSVVLCPKCIVFYLCNILSYFTDVCALLVVDSQFSVVI